MAKGTRTQTCRCMAAGCGVSCGIRGGAGCGTDGAHLADRVQADETIDARDLSETKWLARWRLRLQAEGEEVS